MSNRFVRKSHFRHVFGKTAKKEDSYHDIKLSTYGDGNHLCASENYIVYATPGGGGPIAVIPYAKIGRVGHTVKTVNPHSAKTIDFQFSSFNPNMLATTSEDCMVGITMLPSDPTQFTGKPDNTFVLEGHQKKTDLVSWHPTANGILASSSHDGTVKVWDVEEQKELFSYEISGFASNITWNTNGSLLGISSNKKDILVDPRTGNGAIEFKHSFTNVKGLFHDNIGYYGVGGSMRGCHEYHIYDPKMPGEPITEFEVDDSAGMMVPHYDPDTSILYVGTKGGISVKFFELNKHGDKLHKLSMWTNPGQSSGIKGYTFLPKRMCDWKQCMIGKSLMLYRDSIVPVNFIVPRKSQLFAADIFPDTIAGEPSLDGASWAGGEDKDPVLRSLNPKKAGQSGGGGIKIQSKAELIAENKVLKAKVAALEEELSKLKV